MSDHNRNNTHYNDTSNNGTNLSGQKRRSRFDTDIVDPVLPEQKRLNLEVSVAAAKAAEMSKEIAAKMKLVTSLYGSANNKGTEKKAAYRPLLLDAQGREIDEHGNLVKREILPMKTLAANMAVSNATKKKENPYLAHRTLSTATVPLVATLVPPSTSSANNGVTDGPVVPTVITSADLATASEDGSGAAAAAAAAAAASLGIVVDERLPSKKREVKAKKSLQFVEAGRYVKEATKLLEKEERKMIAGYASGRKQIEKGSLPAIDGLEGTEEGKTEGTMIIEETQQVPPVLDPIVPAMEWWDEAFLPKPRREARKISKAASELDEYELCNILHVKTHKFIQHPIPLKPLGQNDKSVPILPMYLTKKERKKLRKAQRAEREREKRDKMLLGLIPTPEPKFKLSNFMKLLGDQAVADPSKIEMKVVQQMQKRLLNHELRNQKNKLTPQQRRMKKMKKLQEDTSRGVTVAVFRVTDFSCLKYRFQVDITAQQYFLSGFVLLCPDEKLNLVVAEGGPKGIRKFTKLLVQRIKWNVFIPTNTEATNDPNSGENGFELIQSGEEFSYQAVNAQQQQNLAIVADGDGNNGNDAEGGEEGQAREEEAEEGGEAEEDSDDSDSDDSDDEEEGEEDADANNRATSNQVSVASKSKGSGVGSGVGTFEAIPNPNGRCDLLWTGILPKRVFTGFKFQEAKSSIVAKRLLEGKNVGHYWDMVQHADAILASTKSDDIFDLLNF